MKLPWLAAARRRRRSAEAQRGTAISRRLALRAVLFRTFLLVAAISALLVGVLNTWLGMRIETEASRLRLRAAAEDVASLTEGFLARHRGAVRVVAGAAAVGGRLDRSALQRLLDATRQSHPGLLTMIAADARGELVAASPSARSDGRALLGLGINVADRDYFRAAMSRRTSHVSDVFRGRGFGDDLVVALSSPVLLQGGEPLGVVEGSLDLRRLEELVLAARSVPDREVVLVDRSGRRLAGSPVGTVPLELLPGWPWRQPGDDRELLDLELGDDGERRSYVAAFATVAPVGWTVVARRSTRSILGLALSAQVGSLLALLAGLAVFTLGARWVAARTTRSVIALREELGSYTPGRAPTRAQADPGAPSEIADAFASFAALTARLDASYRALTASLGERERLAAELRDLASSLEQQVADRTAELAASEARYRQLVDDSLGLMFRHDLEGRLLMVNPGVAEALGYTPEALVGRSVVDLIPADRRGELERYLGLLRTAGRTEGLIEIYTAFGERRIWHYRNRVIDEPGQQPYVLGHAIDVTARHLAHQEAKHQALHDTLTGLANRLLLDEHLATAIHRCERLSRPLAVIYLDLDGFKEINDRYGHGAGDRVLRQAADRLRGLIRRSDLVARLGGDEMAAVVSELSSPEAAAGVADAIVGALGRDWHDEGGEPLQLSASVGVALWPLHGRSASALLAAADAAMYRAKQSGGDCWRWAESQVERPPLDEQGSSQLDSVEATNRAPASSSGPGTRPGGGEG